MLIISAKKSLKGRPSKDSEAVNVRFERTALKALDDWRRVELDMPTRPEAVRRLVKHALKDKQRQAL